MSTRRLDDIERERWTTATLWGDAGVEAWAALPGTPVATRPLEAGEQAATAAGAERLALNGSWLLAGTEPARQYSIERWAEPAGRKPTALPVTWWREDTDRSSWIPVTVPGTVPRALRDAGLAPDPISGGAMHDELVMHGEPAHWPWHFRRTRAERQEWWYARRFDVPASWAGRRIRLSFDGLDYAASVWVNGRPAAHHSGMYGGPDIDVSSLVRPGGDNEVVVRIEPPPHDWHGVMKPSPGWGWHYGHLISTGIWRSVSLEALPEVEVRHPFAITRELGDDRALVELQWDLERHDQAARPAEPIDVHLTITGPDGAAVARLRAAVAPSGRTTRATAVVVIDDPRLWWPRGYGEQPLYRLEVRAGDSAAAAEFGIRTIEMRDLPERSGEDVYRWRFTINRRPLFVKGVNWCWTDPLGERPFEDDAHLLALAADANLQMLRVWGGGPIERDEFYAACDRMGILVYQEFPLSFGVPDASAADLQVLDEQTARITTRLRNHPSIVMWGGGNENELGLSSDDVFELIGRRVTQLDPSRPFHRTDPWGGSEHSYAVYHEGRAIDEGYRDLDPLVFGEYGTASQCSRESMSRYLDPALLEQWPPAPHGAIVQHQAQFSLFELFKQARYANYGPLTGWREFIECSQLGQADALRFASEQVRAGAGRRTAAYWFYKLGEVFPGSSWAVVDYYNVPKLSYFRVKQFSRARSAFAVSERLDWAPGERFSAAVHVANDTPEPLVGATVRATLWDASSRPVTRFSVDVEAAPDETVSVGRVEAGVPDACAPLLLEVRLVSAEGDSTQWYWFNARPRTEEIRRLEALPVDDLWEHPIDDLLAPYAAARPSPLRDMPRTHLRARLTAEGLEVENAGPAVAPLVVVDGFPHGRGRLLGDNGFGLAAGETRMIPIQAPRSELGALTVRAWNADPTGVG